MNGMQTATIRIAWPFVLLCAAGLLAPLSCVDLDEPELRGSNLGRPASGEGARCGEPPATAEDALVLHFLDVGQGDAVWIQTPDDGEDGNGVAEGLNILVDTGRLGYDDVPSTGEVVVEYLEGHGRPSGTMIDYLVITHAHADHYGGAFDVFDAFRVVNVVDPGFEDDSSSSYTAFLTRAGQEVSENGGTLYRPAVGSLVAGEYDEIPSFGEELNTVLLNSESNLRLGEDRHNQINNTSIGLWMTYNDISVVLMADLESDAEAEIIEALPGLRANILKVGHHGSTTSSSQAFLEQIFQGVPSTRRFAVIQSGLREYGGIQLPASSILTRLGEFVEGRHLFSTEFDDAERSESTAAGDDHVEIVVTAEGAITGCYVD